MEHLDTFILGLILFVISSVLTYLFKMRQLYTVSPKLYRVTPVSQNGSLCEVIVYNKGNQVEEEIRVDIDPELKLELLASNSADVKLNSSGLFITRLHKGEEASALLLVENGLLDHSKLIKISSKTVIGKVLKRTEDVPPNFAKTFLFTVLFLAILPGMTYGMKAYDTYKTFRAESVLKEIYSLGWSNLSNYYYSNLKQSYQGSEFPVRFVGEDKEGNEIIFEAYNKTAIEISISGDNAFSSKDEYYYSKYFKSVSVPPMTKVTFNMLLPEAREKEGVEYDFSFRFGDDFIYGMKYTYIKK